MHAALFAVVLAGLLLRPPAPPATRPAVAVRWDAGRSESPGGKGFAVAAGGAVFCSAARDEDGRRELRVFRSDDLGKTFRPVGTAAVAPAGTDLGDAALLVRRDGEIWISYRQNRHRGADADDPTYTVRTARSLDGGRTWQPPVVVAESRPGPGGPSRGLWASCLFERGDGTLQVYYDDEDTPFRRGFRGHQWVTMRTWDAAAGAWGGPVIAARAKDPAHLSREGMMSVVETAPGRLLMAFESVQVEVPHANLIRGVRSDDGGATWSWQTTGREVIYEPPTRPFMALAPWLSPLGQAGQFACVFCTDEDRERADKSGTPPPELHMDVKCVTSGDAGRTWSASRPVAAESHRYYLPGVAVTVDEDGRRRVLALYLDFASGRFYAQRGEVVAE